MHPVEERRLAGAGYGRRVIGGALADRSWVEKTFEVIVWFSAVWRLPSAATGPIPSGTIGSHCRVIVRNYRAERLSLPGDQTASVSTSTKTLSTITPKWDADDLCRSQRNANHRHGVRPRAGHGHGSKVRRDCLGPHGRSRRRPERHSPRRCVSTGDLTVPAAIDTACAANWMRWAVSDSSGKVRGGGRSCECESGEQ